MQETYTAFIGPILLASGSQNDILAAVKPQFNRDPGAPILVFDDQTGKQVDFDLRETPPAAPARPGPGRPKLGVVPREISLLPRHWEWLERQPNGASAAIRRLVDEAAKRNSTEDRTRLAIEATGRFLTAMAGNLAGYEEACRALYARRREQFDDLIRDWPEDIRLYAQRLFPKNPTSIDPAIA